jgi:site-specific recombinase XerD
MSMQSSGNVSRIEQLKIHLRTERYTAAIQQRYLWIVQRFLDYLQSKALMIEAVREAHLAAFLRWELLSFRRRHGRAPRDVLRWRRRYTRALHMVLRLVHGQWPVVVEPATAREAFHCQVILGFDTWMRDLRGLAPITRTKRATNALRFLTALGPRGDQEDLKQLRVREIDAYVKQRCEGLRRSSLEDCIGNLRAFLRYLHASGRIEMDLSGTVIGPRIYDHEQIPPAICPEDIENVLQVTRQDLSPSGRRDYAILMLLVTYGLRAGEIVALRLQDIDWRKEILYVRHSKTGTHSELPLLHLPGDAILSYLQKARPTSPHREVFLYTHAPYRPFKSGSGLCGVLRVRLRAAGITPLGRKGTHAFRHARAVSLLRGAVPLKIIGDILGHKSERSTAVYLKLAMDDLRAVGLDLPKGVS